jgi:hypothetical protein
MGLPTSPTASNFPLDYHLSVQDICKRTVLHLVEADKNLRPLLRWSEKTMSLPTWFLDFPITIPDFDLKPLLNPFSRAGFAAPS